MYQKKHIHINFPFIEKVIFLRTSKRVPLVTLENNCLKHFYISLQMKPNKWSRMGANRHLTQFYMEGKGIFLTQLKSILLLLNCKVFRKFADIDWLLIASSSLKYRSKLEKIFAGCTDFLSNFLNEKFITSAEPEMQRRIHNPIKYLRWDYLRK